MRNEFAEQGGSIYPAGGSIYPAGYTSSGKGIDTPIQLGSPYISIDSPAMKPFMPTHSQLSGYNPIKHKLKGGEGVVGSKIGEVVGQFLGDMLPI
jgi:hypothetical protein